jgi:hypothetical protein
VVFVAWEIIEIYVLVHFYSHESDRVLPWYLNLLSTMEINYDFFFLLLCILKLSSTTRSLTSSCSTSTVNVCFGYNGEFLRTEI